MKEKKKDTKENEESFEILSEIIFFQNEIFKMTKSWVIMNILYVAEQGWKALRNGHMMSQSFWTIVPLCPCWNGKDTLGYIIEFILASCLICTLRKSNKNGVSILFCFWVY